MDETIYEGVVETSYLKNNLADSEPAGHNKKIRAVAAFSRN